MARVLVIDDESSMRFTLEAVLGDAGPERTTADGGAAGIKAFEDGGADVVITDLAMPEVDGMKVLATLRAQDPTVPVMIRLDTSRSGSLITAGNSKVRRAHWTRASLTTLAFNTAVSLTTRA